MISPFPYRNICPGLLSGILVASICFSADVSIAAETDTPLPILQALTKKDLACTWKGDGRNTLSLTVNNTSAGPVEIAIPAGQILGSQENAGKVIVLRSALLSVPVHGSAEALLPAAASSSANEFRSQAFQPSPSTEPRLDSLLKYLATQPDAPRETAQLAVLCLLENVTFQQWQQFLTSQRSGEPAGRNQPTPAEVTQAIDALGILRKIAPGQTFALGNDSELKLRALRNPWCRAKAMQLYGIAIPAASGEGGPLPDLGQLLHTKPGDNCPICRQRALMQQPAGDF